MIKYYAAKVPFDEHYFVIKCILNRIYFCSLCEQKFIFYIKLTKYKRIKLKAFITIKEEYPYFQKIFKEYIFDKN